MPKGLPDPKTLGFYVALGQVGLEMVAPLVLGLILDSYLGWMPWATLVGATLGFVGGLAHLILMASQGPPRGDS